MLRGESVEAQRVVAAALGLSVLASVEVLTAGAHGEDAAATTALSALLAFGIPLCGLVAVLRRVPALATVFWMGNALYGGFYVAVMLAVGLVFLPTARCACDAACALRAAGSGTSADEGWSLDSPVAAHGSLAADGHSVHSALALCSTEVLHSLHVTLGVAAIGAVAHVVGAVVGRRLTRTGALSVPKGSGPMPPLRTAAPLVGFGGGRPPAAYAKRPSWVWPQGPAAGYGFAKGAAGPRQAAAVANGGSAATAPVLGPVRCGAAQAPWNPLASAQLQSPRRAAAAASRQALQAHLGVHGVGSPCDPSALAAIAPWLLDPLEGEAGASDCV